MPGKITELNSITGIFAATTDTVELVDISDTSMAATGTNKKITLAEFISFLSLNGVGTIAANSVTNAMLVDMAPNSFKGNNTGGAADPVDLTVAQMQTALSIRGAMTGDVTANAGSGATTIANNAVTSAKILDGAVTSGKILDNAVNNPKILDDAVTNTKIFAGAVTNAKLAQAAASTFKGNATGATAAVTDMTVATAKTLLAIDQVSNTSDANKPVSTATATAISNHVTNASGAHAASAVSYPGFGALGATNVHNALDELQSEKVALSGDTMTGNLIIPNGTIAGHAVNKSQLDAKLSLTGGTVTGPAVFSNTVEIIEPVDPGNAASKYYVDMRVDQTATTSAFEDWDDLTGNQGRYTTALVNNPTSQHAPLPAATYRGVLEVIRGDDYDRFTQMWTAHPTDGYVAADAPLVFVRAYTYVDGITGWSGWADISASSGGSSLSSWKESVRVASSPFTNYNFPSGLLVVDGVTLVEDDRVLLKSQSTSSSNGIWVAHSGAWLRAADFNTAENMLGGVVMVREGTTQADTMWVCVNNAPITVDATGITWVPAKLAVGLSNVDNTSDLDKPVSSAQSLALAPIRRVPTIKTSTTYTPVFADENTFISLSNASPITVTLPSSGHSTGAEIDFHQSGAGQVTFVAGGGSFVSGTGTKTRVQQSVVTAKKITASTWLIIGDLAP